ncbi:hypothetical protein J2Y48_003946 [Mycoplana sp. BE70]|uniref:hypothetical protein n=1 Tax=Mycoplana sp. BE70 TaxID=2817775 RepID=UPI00285F3370|nr:hypothetical protein [Mycoplana sp. BE70]MDR6758638.1 hypothetical protein [Mycoplana sp. BE70]
MTFVLTRYAGLYLPPAAWAVNTQLGQILPYGDCSAGARWTAFAAFIAAIVAVSGVIVSQRATAATVSRTVLFLGRIAFLLGLSFAFALVLQGAATVLVNPCLH